MATIASDISDTTRTFRVSGDVSSVDRGLRFRLDDELLDLVGFEPWPVIAGRRQRGFDPNNWIVNRGVGTSVAASHTSGTEIFAAVSASVSSATLTAPDPFGDSGGGGGVTVTVPPADPVAVTNITAPGATISEGSATLVPVLSGHGAPVAGVNEGVQITYDDSFPITGTFRLTFGGDETTDIDVQTTLVEDIVAALEALPSIGAGNIAADGGTGSSFVDNGGELDLVFAGDLGFEDVGDITVTSVAMMHNATPVTDASGFSVSPDDGSLGVPPVAGTAAIYVDLDTGDQYVNAGDQDSPSWVKTGPLGLAAVLSVNNDASSSTAIIQIVQSGTVTGGGVSLDSSRPGNLTLGQAGTDEGGNATLTGGQSADDHGSPVTGGIVEAFKASGTDAGGVSVAGGGSVSGHVGASINVRGATASADGTIRIVSGLPSSDPLVAGQLFTDGAPSANTPKALMVSGGS